MPVLGQAKLSYPVVKKSIPVEIKENSPRKRRIEILDSDSDNEDVSPSKRSLGPNKYSLRSTPSQSVPLVKFYSERRPIPTAQASPSDKTPERVVQTALKAPHSQPVTTHRPARKCLDFSSVSASPSAKSVLSRQLPNQLSCREKELQTLKDFLSGCLEEENPKSFYISGPPGTGKTACLKRTIAVLKNDFEFKEIFINCMTVKNPNDVFKMIIKELGATVKQTRSDLVLAQLKRLIVASKQMIVLALDEIDQLDTKSQDVLYSAFEWPFIPGSNLILMGIANSLDLTERALPKLNLKVCQKPKLLHFKPYSKEEIVTIISSRLKEADGQLEPAAVEMCARKVSAVTGDIRKALDICSLAVGKMERREMLKEHNENQSGMTTPSKKVVGVVDIIATVKEVYGNKAESSQSVLPLQQKLLLVSTLRLFKAGHKQVLVTRLYTGYRKACELLKVAGVDQSEFSSLVSLLQSQGLIEVTKAKDLNSRKIKLAVDERAVELATRDQNLLSAVSTLAL